MTPAEHRTVMVKKKRLRLIAEMARKIRAYRELKSRPKESQKYALDYETMKRPLTGKMLPVLAWQDVRKESRLFSLLASMRITWIMAKPGGSSPTRVSLDMTVFNVVSTGRQENEAKEVDKVMYHDWRLIPKHMEQQFKDFEPLPEPPVRYVAFPPLLRAMMLAQHKKERGSVVSKEPALPLKRDVVLNKDYFQRQEQDGQSSQGTAV
uniref:Mitochondrial ribosomal protein S34 n=1 Tax=Labrus bergylta TaxID=56723 RepID=A0A3Q3GMT4_9LABR